MGCRYDNGQIVILVYEADYRQLRGKFYDAIAAGPLINPGTEVCSSRPEARVLILKGQTGHADTRPTSSNMVPHSIQFNSILPTPCLLLPAPIRLSPPFCLILALDLLDYD